MQSDVALKQINILITLKTKIFLLYFAINSGLQTSECADAYKILQLKLIIMLVHQ